MRVVFTAWAWPSHIYALVPLAWACRSAGHEVLFASEPAALPDIARTGLPSVAVGADVDTVALVRQYLDPGHRPGRTPGRPRALEMVAAHAESMVDGLTALTRRWRADVVVSDPTTLAGPLAAAAAGVPAVRHLFGTDLMVRDSGALRDVLERVAARFGVDPCDPMGAVTLDPVPPALRIPTGYQRLPIRWMSFNGGGAVPPDTGGTGGRPAVCVTWGYTMARLDPARFLAGEIARALGALGADVLVAVSAAQAGLLGPLPRNTRVVHDAPLHHVLGGCDVVVAHGGAGTILTSLAHGLPLLLVPQLPDHRAHAERLAAGGAGLVLDRDGATPDAVRAAVGRLLAEEEPQAAARTLQQEIHRMPAPSAVVPELELIAAGDNRRALS
ncbi:MULTISPECIES: nucleotide disphospho-sugar-binding domain-containing protein [Amycolatopsis]|uniref:nucleotide disphospho-sugar-binding domain-containing protein n=1 Tax=Amycolatopsis TaxID=1813 RepID=UPI000B8B4C81|nr:MULTISPECIES: nucleotide disphospho-sugar-binding domain-containing protein [Amycolatopsis]OXM62271.1 protein IroB [Amycolatopsis sp. KNN50.9b]